MTFEALQWLGAVASVVGAWLVADARRCVQAVGFGCFLAANLTLGAWAALGGHHGILAMQALFTASSVRGLVERRESQP